MYHEVEDDNLNELNTMKSEMGELTTDCSLQYINLDLIPVISI